MGLKVERGRTLARSQALQLLFQAEALGLSVDEVLAGDYLIDKGPLDDYAVLLATGADAERERIDVALHVVSENWPINRMPAVDRNLLRLSVYELRLMPEPAPDVAVVIDEAVEIAKAYGTDESPRFVNGVLGRIAREDELPDFLHRACAISADDAEAACIAALWFEIDPGRVPEEGEGPVEDAPFDDAPFEGRAGAQGSARAWYSSPEGEWE